MKNSPDTLYINERKKNLLINYLKIMITNEQMFRDYLIIIIKF